MQIADSGRVPEVETVIFRRFIVPLALSVMNALCAEVGAQGTFPAPLPNQSNNAASPFPSPSSGSAAARKDVLSQGAAPLGDGLAAGDYSGGRGGGGGNLAERQECMEKLAPLRQDAEKKAQAIKAANDRKATPKEACGLITSYVEAEAQLVSYVTTRQTACGIPAAYPEQLRANQERSNALMKAVCAAANHRSPDDQFRPPPGQLPNAAPSRNWGR
jgi:hypothetical protein